MRLERQTHARGPVDRDVYADLESLEVLCDKLGKSAIVFDQDYVDGIASIHLLSPHYLSHDETFSLSSDATEHKTSASLELGHSGTPLDAGPEH